MKIVIYITRQRKRGEEAEGEGKGRERRREGIYVRATLDCLHIGRQVVAVA